MIAVIYIAAEIDGLFIRSCPFSLRQKYQLPVHLTFMDGAHTIHTELINSGDRTWIKTFFWVLQLSWFPCCRQLSPLKHFKAHLLQVSQHKQLLFELCMTLVWIGFHHSINVKVKKNLRFSSLMLKIWKNVLLQNWTRKDKGCMYFVLRIMGTEVDILALSVLYGRLSKGVQLDKTGW